MVSRDADGREARYSDAAAAILGTEHVVALSDGTITIMVLELKLRGQACRTTSIEMIGL